MATIISIAKLYLGKIKYLSFFLLYNLTILLIHSFFLKSYFYLLIYNFVHNNWNFIDYQDLFYLEKKLFCDQLIRVVWQLKLVFIVKNSLYLYKKSYNIQKKQGGKTNIKDFKVKNIFFSKTNIYTIINT